MFFNSDKIWILDGGLGTMIQGYDLGEKDFRGENPDLISKTKELKGNNECLNLTRPDILSEICRKYIDAGADIITTNTFSASRISQKEYDCEDLAYEMARRGAEIARAEADKADRKILVAGSIGPTSKSLTLAPDINNPSFRIYSFDEMVEAFCEQARGLVDGGADVLLIETAFDALNTKATLYAIEKVAPGFPVMVSASPNDKSGRTLTGQTLEAFYNSIRHYRSNGSLESFGINCSLGAEDLLPLIKDVSEFCEVPVSCHPNAGLPNEMGKYDETPEQMAASVRKMAEQGLVNIVGGCCGTTPDHIRAVAEAVRGLKPHKVGDTEDARAGISPLKASGLEAVKIDRSLSNFVNIGERTNVAGSRKFAKLIAAGNYDTALQIAADQIENGASVIDINMDDAMLDSKAEMEKFVRTVMNDPAVAKAALMIDSSHWDTIIAGLKNAQGKCIVNSISLKEGEELFLEKARTIKELGAAVVVMAFDEKGQATTYDRKVEICSRAYGLLTKTVGMDPDDIIFDVNVLSIGTGIEEHARYAIDFIEAVRWIKSNLPGARTSGGISNLSFAFRGNNPVREAMHSAFLFHAIKAGLDMGIVNPAMLKVYDDVEPDLLKKVEDVIFNTDPDATERLIAKAQEIAEAATAAATGATSASSTTTATIPGATPGTTPEADVDARLSNALVKGNGSTLKEDVTEALAKYGKAVKVIEGPLMAGMEKVGELFGAGKMFLPQVVKSAKIMKDCVDILQPYMDAEAEGDGGGNRRPVVINATVKGDVHDIGKNITGIVLGCNGFDVIDLGVMVDKERILDTAAEKDADIIGASGLITPSLYQMEELCREMTRRGMDTPLFIGGATTSALHTAVKLAPLYDHVFYAPDASASAVMAKRCMMDRQKFEKEEHEAQQKIRTIYEKKAEGQADLETGSEATPKTGYNKESYLSSWTVKSIPAKEIEINDVEKFFDWRMFLAVWGFKYGGQLPHTPEIRKTLDDGQAVLDRFRKNHEVIITLADSIFAADTKDNVISVYDENGKKADFPMLRQEEGRLRSLADFVPDSSFGIRGPFGMFAISVRYTNAHKPGCQCAACTNEYESMMERAVRVTLAEAASLWLDSQLQKDMPEGVKVSKPAAGYASCPDHTIKKDILAHLDGADKLGISFTESFAMIPDASICGFICIHPNAAYPEVRKISREQYETYKERRGMSDKQAEQFLGILL
ncbi:MAG: methionine synthase [Bacteroidales bacterium]|nr:methionine synthase [Bacteroidales bacterium]